MSCCINTQDGEQGSTPAAAAAAPWTERFIGDYVAAPSVNLAVGVQPTVLVRNDTATAGQVPSAVLTSNAGDPVGTAAQTGTSGFATDGNGLRYTGNALQSSLLTEVAQNAPHVWTLWRLLLGEDPRAGVDYCILVRFGSQNVNTNAQSTGVAIYELNDGAANPTIRGNPAIDDEKRLSGAIEMEGGVLGVISREESPPFQQLVGAGLPLGYNVVGLMLGGQGVAQAVVGVSPGFGLFPTPDELTPVPGPFLGGSTTYPSHPYLVPDERVAMYFQQQLGSSYSAAMTHFQVLSRGGRSAP